MSLKDLPEVPESVSRAAAVVAALDRCFLVGFGRLGPEQAQALQALGRICSATPLAESVGAAVEALTRNEFVERHFAALAAARAAVQGAQYDALRAHAAKALGRAVSSSGSASSETTAVPEPVKVWQESTRHWLMELAIAGFGQLEPQALAPFGATLEQLQGEPSATRLAALLTGFQQELLRSMPISALPHIPLFRWADLWTRAMVGALRPPPAVAGTKASGALSPLGLDLRQHGFFVSADLYGLFEEGKSARLVRVTLSSYKVDVVRGGELWRCFGPRAEPLLRALARHEALKVKNATLLPTGDLLWDGEAKAGTAFSWTDAAKRLAPGAEDGLATPLAAPVDRHPVQLAEPVFLENFAASEDDGWRLDLGDGVALGVATKRIGQASELRPEHLKKAASLFGLLRFDGGAWSVQPLAVSRPGQKPAEAFTGSGACDAPPAKKKATLGVLRERASRLLRKKS